MPVLKDGELVLYGFVGENFWDEGFTASDVVDALMDIGRDTDVTVRINSGGGYVDDGIAIYNALVAHRGSVTVVIDAMAASSASLIAMAGDTIRMRAGSMMMIHDPALITIGNAAAHEASLDRLDKWAGQLASIYAARTGRPESEIRETMQQEVWLTADEAVAEGYADEVEAAKARAVASFDFRIYANAPERLTALARRKNWSLSETGTRAAASATAPSRQAKEQSMTDKPKADNQAATIDIDQVKAEAARDAVKADRERRAAIMAIDEAKGREELAERLYMTDLGIDQIKEILAAAPKASASESNEPPADLAQQRAAAASLAMPGTPEHPRKATGFDAGRAKVLAIKGRQA